jgi:hypothetical protein
MKITSLILAGALLAASALPAAASKPAGVVTLVQGSVSRLLDSAAKPAAPAALKVGDAVFADDRITTGANGRAALVLTDGTQLKLNYNTDIVLHAKTVAGKSNDRGIASIKILLGDLWSKITKKKSIFEFETPSAVAAVKGSSGEVSADAGQTCIQWSEGKLAVSNDLGSQMMGALQQMCVAKGFAPPAPAPWTPPASSWSSSLGGVEAATLQVKVKDADGSEKTLVIEYR